MALVFRTDQSTPLTNDQLDNNFKYLRDQTNLKYSIGDFTAANISLKLRTTVGLQTSLDLAQANAINAWRLRDLEPYSGLPSTSDKSSLVSRDSSGNITVSSISGILYGNASTATLSENATKLATPRTINGVLFDGSSNISITDSTKLPLAGGYLSGKLFLLPAQNTQASINFGANLTSPEIGNRSNGDMWATTSGLFYHIQGQTDQVAPLTSPTFTGIPRAPGFSGIASQISTLSHLDNATATLNSAIVLKANIESPTFTGTPTAPTPLASSNNTSISTTAYVTSAVLNKANEITTAYQANTSSAIVSYSNTVNQLLALKANIESPTFTGTPTAPTAVNGTNNTQLATTAFTASAISTLQTVLNSAVAALQDSINSTRPIPVGAVFYMSYITVPYGYLEANGQAVSRTTYAALWQYLGSPNTGNGSTTFNIPDYRGEFLRGWDNGRGVDTNRTIGSVQYGSIESHTHAYVDTYYKEAWGSVAAFNGDHTGSRGGQDYDNNDYNYYRTTNATGSNETRPRNVALMPVIKW